MLVDESLFIWRNPLTAKKTSDERERPPMELENSRHPKNANNEPGPLARFDKRVSVRLS